MRDFENLLRQLALDLHGLGGWTLSWKDADPSSWGDLPATLSQHQHPRCLEVKSNREHLETCCGFDNILAFEGPARLKTCPLGFTEWALPLRDPSQHYLGCLYLGFGNKKRPPITNASFA